MGGRGGSPNPGPAAAAAPTASGDRQWWQDDPVASAIVQAYVDVKARPHITAAGTMAAAGERDTGVSVLDIRQNMAAHGADFSREQVDTTLRKMFRGSSLGTSYDVVYPVGFAARGIDHMKYRAAAYHAGGETKAFVILTKARNLPRPRS